MTPRGPRWRVGCGGRRSQRGWRCGHGPCSSSPMDSPTRTRRSRLGWPSGTCASGPNASSRRGSLDCRTGRDQGAGLFSPPDVALHVVKIACERPDDHDRSLCQWDCAEIARTLVAEGVVDGISSETVRRILSHHKLKPWRHHLWLSAKTPRDAAFARQVQALADLYTRPLAAGEVVLSLDEKTSLQPRTRLAPTRPARRGQPVRVEHEYKRGGRSISSPPLTRAAAMSMRRRPRAAARSSSSPSWSTWSGTSPRPSPPSIWSWTTCACTPARWYGRGWRPIPASCATSRPSTAPG